MREGEKGVGSIRHFTKKYGITLSHDEIVKYTNEKEELFKKLPKPEIFPGIPEILNSLKKRIIPLALVTGTSYDELKEILPHEIFEHFEVKITGDMVNNGKPDPEPFLLASHKLNIQPERCLVVENAPFGIASAKDAGMTCIAICSSLNANYLKDADIILFSIDELNQFLTQINFEL